MKIKTVAALCKKSKVIRIFEKTSDEGYTKQWVGNGYSMYPLQGLPQVDENMLYTIFDFSEKEREKINFSYFDNTEGDICFEDIDQSEKMIETEYISIIQGEDVLRSLRTSRGIQFINSKFLAPLANALDEIELYERVTPKGMTYIVAKMGFLLQAVIMPYDPINENFVKNLEEFSKQCRTALQTKK